MKLKAAGRAHRSSLLIEESISRLTLSKENSNKQSQFDIIWKACALLDYL